MKKIVKSFAIIGFCLMAVILSGCDRAWTGTVRGSVTDNETELGVPGVVVSARSLKNSYAVSTLTDESGEYRLSDVRWGPNKVRVYHPRYSSIEKYADVIRDNSIDLDFNMTESRLYMDAILQVQIRNTYGDPINQAVVDLYQLKSNYYDYYFLLNTLVTSEDGYLEFVLPRMYEDEILRMQIRVVALNHIDETKDFVVTWGDQNPLITVVMQPI